MTNSPASEVNNPEFDPEVNDRVNAQFRHSEVSATALHIAAKRGNVEIARLLIHRGAVVDPKDPVVRTSMARHLALTATPGKHDGLPMGSVAIADLNGDGKADVLIGSRKRYVD